MANIKLAFLGAEMSYTEDNELQCYVTEDNLLCITIDINNGLPPSPICLDEETAVKFCKHLKSQIAIIKSHERI